MSSQVQATMGEKMGCILAIFDALTLAACAALRYPFLSASQCQPTVWSEMHRIVVRRLLDRINVAQIQWANASSSKAYQSWIATKAKMQDAPTNVFTEVIGDEGVKLHWIGPKSAKKVLLHYHGGGYVIPMLHAHMNLLNNFRREIKRRSGVEVKLAFLEYTLVPLARYPTQFREGAIALQHIFASGISPADIVISGDSAGGLLAIQMLSHILHPHPSVPIIPVPAAPLAGILLMSSWVVFASKTPSFVADERDILSKKPLLDWGNMIRQGTVLDGGRDEPGGYWGEPLKAPAEWWRDTGKVTRNVMITWGEFEAFRDDDSAFGKKLKESVGPEVDVVTVEGPRGVHIGPTVDAALGREPSELTKIITDWVHYRVTI